MVISMDNPSDYLGLDGSITDNDAPVDALAQALLRGAEACSFGPLMVSI